jgi:hypothetical protein
MNLSISIAATLISLLVVLTLRNKPRTPPRAIKRESDLSFKDQMKQLPRDYWLAATASAMALSL